jgi:hypothetical protein
VTGGPGWEQPAPSRRPALAAVLIAGLLVLVGVRQLEPGGDDEALPGVPIEVVEEPLPPPEPTPVGPAAPPVQRWIRLDQTPGLLQQPAPAVWTGSRLVVWTGTLTAVWDAVRDVWHAGAPSPARHDGGWSATWAGHEVLYFGGVDDGATHAGLLAYQPQDDQWWVGQSAPVSGRVRHAAVWDGTRLHVWGGLSDDAALADGASYEPATDSWEPIPPAPISPRADAAAVWLEATGELVVWGGSDGERQLLDGAAYRPADGRWRQIPDAPWEHREPPAVTSDGEHRLFVWGLPAAGLHLPDGAVYDALTDTWAPLPDLLAQERAGASALYVDGTLVVWGGWDRRLEAGRTDGFALDLAARRWRQIPPADMVPRLNPVLAWVDTPTVQGLLVWGGQAADGPRSDGALHTGPLVRPPVPRGGTVGR